VVQKKGNRFSNHLMDSIPKEANYMPFVFSPGAPIEIVSEIASFQKSFTFIQPSEENRSLISLRDIRFSSFELYSAATAKGSKEESSLLEADERYQRYIKSMIDFADTTGSIETAMVAIRWISPSGDFERLPEFVHDQCEKWHHERPDHAFTNQLCQVADKNKLPVLVGDRMPDYPLPMTNGDTLLVSQLLGKRITLIDIWASWCAPCRKENRVVLVPLWAEYKDRGLQIIGYSIDNDAVSWRAAIAKDEASWKNASHLTGDDTPFLNTLRITTIPANFILDAKGKIIAKNLYGEALTTFVEEYLK
jgi:peroxiredoxin